MEKVRVKQGKKEEPTVGIVDAQCVKNTLVSSRNRGFDAGKKIKGIKRHSRYTWIDTGSGYTKRISTRQGR